MQKCVASLAEIIGYPQSKDKTSETCPIYHRSKEGTVAVLSTSMNAIGSIDGGIFGMSSVETLAWCWNLG
jgi:hypothetical protein